MGASIPSITTSFDKNILDSSGWPWENWASEEKPPVSLCVAATCRYQDNPAIVICCDKAGTRGETKSEDIDKVKEVGRSVALLAGNMSLAKALCAECAPTIRQYVPGSNELAATQLKIGLQAAVRRRKRVCPMTRYLTFPTPTPAIRSIRRFGMR